MSRAGLAFFGFAVMLYCAWTICAIVSIGPLGGSIALGIWWRMQEIQILFFPLMALCLIIGTWFAIRENRPK